VSKLQTEGILLDRSPERMGILVDIVCKGGKRGHSRYVGKILPCHKRSEVMQLRKESPENQTCGGSNTENMRGKK